MTESVFGGFGPTLARLVPVLRVVGYGGHGSIRGSCIVGATLLGPQVDGGVNWVREGK